MRQVSTALLLLLTSLALASCSGVPNGTPCVTNCSGNATVSVVLTATPPPPGSQLSVQAFTATIIGLALTPSGGGSDIPVDLNSTTYVAEFTRVTSDSTLLASQVSIPAQTYSKVKVTFAAPRVTFCTQATPGVPGCTAGSLATVTGTVGTATINTNLSFATNQQAGIVLNANLGTALSQSGQTIAGVDLNIADAFSAAALPPVSTATDLASGKLSHIDDVMGLVINKGSSSLTIQTSGRGNITASTNSSTQYSNNGCTTQDFSCVRTNDIAVLDAILNADGTLTATFYQPVITSTDLIEGVVTSVPNSVTNQFVLVATDSVFTPSNSVLNGQLNLGDQIVVTLAGTVQPFVIVDKGLGSTLPVNNFDGSTSISSVQPGMTVAFPVTSYTPQSGTTPGATSTNVFALRFTRVTTTMATATLPDFSANGSTFAPFLGISTNQQFRTASSRISVDGATGVTSIPAGSTISTSALYLGLPSNPLFVAQSVRAH